MDQGRPQEPVEPGEPARRLTACPVCDATGLSEHLPGLLRCGRCTHVVADLSLSSEELTALYQKDYFFGDEYQNYVDDKAALQRNFRARLDSLRPLLPPRPRRLLEIGSAYGFFLEVASPEFDAVEGIDVVEDGVAFARQQLGLSVTLGDFLTHDFGERRFDVIAMWDTIEHLLDPRAFVERAAQLLAPGGVFAVTTGDISSVNARLRKERWRLIHPPTHVHYFTSRSLRGLLEASGLAVVHQEYCGFYRSVGNTLHNALATRPRSWRRLERLVPATLKRRFFYLNLFDITYVIGRKR